MRIHLLSDLHFEFQRWRRVWSLDAVDADVHVLAGDIGVGLEGIQWALANFSKPVIYVLGNHEYYGQRPMMELLEKARQKTIGTNVHLLENDRVVIDGVRFLGCTLWTNFCLFGAARQLEMMEIAAEGMSDFATIHVNAKGVRSSPRSVCDGGAGRRSGDRLTPEQVLEMHCVSRQFLEQQLAPQAIPLDGEKNWVKTVVVTHHAPSRLSLHASEAESALSVAYASPLDDLVARCDLWLHGHVHAIRDYQIGGKQGGRVVVNARGYKDQGPGVGTVFNPFCIVEI